MKGWGKMKRFPSRSIGGHFTALVFLQKMINQDMSRGKLVGEDSLLVEHSQSQG
jgi:hypothetical protein